MEWFNRHLAAKSERTPSPHNCPVCDSTDLYSRPVEESTPADRIVAARPFEYHCHECGYEGFGPGPDAESPTLSKRQRYIEHAKRTQNLYGHAFKLTLLGAGLIGIWQGTSGGSLGNTLLLAGGFAVVGFALTQLLLYWNHDKRQCQYCQAIHEEVQS